MLAQQITTEEPFASLNWEDARCRQLGRHGVAVAQLFFSDQIDDIAAAKAICRGCPLARPCLQGALDRAEPGGVWGGELLANGQVLAFKRGRGRPRKCEDAAVSA